MQMCPYLRTLRPSSKKSKSFPPGQHWRLELLMRQFKIIIKYNLLLVKPGCLLKL